LNNVIFGWLDYIGLFWLLFSFVIVSVIIQMVLLKWFTKRR